MGLVWSVFGFDDEEEMKMLRRRLLQPDASPVHADDSQQPVAEPMWLRLNEL